MNKIGLSIGAALLLGAIGVGVYALVPTGTSIQGVYIGTTDVSRKSKDEIARIMADEFKAHNTITVIDKNGKEKVISFRDLGITLNEEATINRIMEYGYEDDLRTYILHRFQALWYTKELGIQYQFEEPQGLSYLIQLGKSIDTPAQDASVQIVNGELSFQKAKVGSQLDVKATYEAIKEALRNQSEGPVRLVIKERVEPKVTDADMAQLNTILGTYSTDFNAGDANRSHNIEIASTKINGTLVKPNEVFSFNEVVGERTAEAGFDDAPVFVGGKLVPGVGGGICQVSSTLFNVALLSGMEIVERDTHFAPVSYIPKGRDATVAYGYIDFKFRNTYKHPVYVISTIVGGTLQIYIIGDASDKPKSVSITTGGEKKIPHKTVESIDPNSDKDVVEEGHDGLSMYTTRTIHWQNRSDTETFDSVYEPLDTIIVKGGKKPVEPKKDEKKESIEKPEGKGKTS